MSTYDLSRRAQVTMAGTGIAGTVVFFLVAFAPMLPMYGDSLVEYGSWAPAHRSDAVHEVGLLLLSYLLYLLFGVFVASMVRGDSPWSQLVGRIALTAVGVKFAIEMMQIAVLIVPTGQDPAGFVGAMAQFGTTLSGLSLVPYALFLTAVGVAALRSPACPRWLAWFTLLVGAVHITGMLLGLVSVSDIPGLVPDTSVVIFGYIWFASIPGWYLVTGAALLISATRIQSRTMQLAT